MVLPPYTSPLIIPSRDSHKPLSIKRGLRPPPYKRMDMFHTCSTLRRGGYQRYGVDIIRLI
jgi:hypothetical protein